MIILDIDQPKNCFKCPMNRGEYSPNEIEKRYCALTHRSFSQKDYQKRPKDCPIKERGMHIPLDEIKEMANGDE